MSKELFSFIPDAFLRGISFFLLDFISQHFLPGKEFPVERLIHTQIFACANLEIFKYSCANLWKLLSHGKIFDLIQEKNIWILWICGFRGFCKFAAFVNLWITCNLFFFSNLGSEKKNYLKKIIGNLFLFSNYP